MASQTLWTINSGTTLAVLQERNAVNIDLPIVSGLTGVDIEVISGKIPPGTRIENSKLVGTAFEVKEKTDFSCVLRATWMGMIDDRTVKITVVGADEPQWATPPGLLPVGSDNRYFILDSEPIDFQLFASDTDLPAGDVLDYFIAEGDGNLPPGITMDNTGKLTGVTEPLISLDKRLQGGGYDTVPYGELPLDFAVVSGNGYDSFFYDSQTYGFGVPTQSQRKLNRYYPFAVTVTDGQSFIRREFNIYVVGDDFLRADNTIMKVANGVFTADNTHIRTPIWITPSDLGFRRADNYQTIYLETINPPTLSGAIGYTLDNTNNDGSLSELPPGMVLDGDTGIIAGKIPYQPAVTEDYKFTVRATRFTGDTDIATIFANFYEDTLSGNTSFKIYKIDLTGNQDGVNDLLELVGREILLGDNKYTVKSVDNTNENYDIITVDKALLPKISLLTSKKANMGQDYIVVDRLTTNQKDKYQNRKLKFSDTETYTIENIASYIEYSVTNSTEQNNAIHPASVPAQFSQTNYVVGEIVEYQSAIYKCTTAHAASSFLPENWSFLGNTIADLNENDLVKATEDALRISFGNRAYITVVSKNNWRILVPSTIETRNIQTISDFFASGNDSTINSVSLVRDNQDVIQLDINLSRQINQGRNIGISLFQNDFFNKDIAVVSTDPVDNPSKSKTFTLRVIGEIDSEITWLTDSNLGTISANLPSVLKVRATSTVPNTQMVYRLVSGKLPNGMMLSYNGEIIGRAQQFAVGNSLGLTTFDNKLVTWDGSFPGDTTFDRRYTFTVEARDRFNYSATTKEFNLFVEDLDNTKYTDVYMKPLLKPEQREYYRDFISDNSIFTANSVYRPDDPEFGVQAELKCLVYAGIEAKNIENFVAAAAKNHKKKRYILGEPRIATAALPGTRDVIYEVIYVPVIDPQESNNGKTREKFTIKNNKNITADSIQYETKDDSVKKGVGIVELPVYGRQTVKFVVSETQSIRVLTRESGLNTITTTNDSFLIDIRDDGDITVQLNITDAEPFRFRPISNTLKADSDAIRVSESNDIVRYISNITNMRDRIFAIGKTERDYLPLWMRTPQSGFQELDYIAALPIVFCKPGTASDILLNITSSDFDFKKIDYQIDRYIVQRTQDNEQERYILFANYSFNV